MEPMKPMAPMKPMEPMKPMDPPASDWWPKGLSNPSSSGSQNDLRYAFSPISNDWPSNRTEKSPSTTPAITRSRV